MCTDPGEQKPKRLRASSNQSIAVSNDGAVPYDSAETHTVHLYEITVEPSQQTATSAAESGAAGESVSSLQTVLNPLASNVPLTLLQADLSDSAENTEEVVVLSEGPAGERQDDFMNGIAATVFSQGRRLVMNDSTFSCAEETLVSDAAEDLTYTTEELSDIHEGHETQVIAYFETIPNVLPNVTPPQFTFSPDTVLSSALSSEPITSTLPIVSKHVAPSPTSLVLTVERLDTEGGDEGGSEEDDAEQPEHQLEEHW